MAKRVQHIGHNSAAADQFTGLDREITLDTTNKTVRVHDGVNKGGFALALASLSNVADATTTAAGKMSAAQVSQLDAATAGVSTNAANIATNVSDIATNAANIATNAANISTNTTNISTNAANIATNTSDIAARLVAANNLSDVANAATSRSNLGLGSIATQNVNAVAITGGSISGITDLVVADGGSGRSSATAYGVIIGGTTSVNPHQSVAVGSSGQVLTSNGAGAAPSMKDLPASKIILNAGSSTLLIDRSTGAGNRFASFDLTEPDIKTSNATTRSVCPISGTIKDFWFKPKNNSLNNSTVITLRKNGVDSSITVTQGTNNTANSDTTNTLAVTAGDSLELKLNTSASSGTLSGASVGLTIEI